MSASLRLVPKPVASIDNDQRSNDPGRRHSDTAVPLREYLEVKIAQLEAVMGTEMAHMKADILEAKTEFKDGISSLRNDFAGLSTGLHGSMLGLQQSIEGLKGSRRDMAMTWKTVAKIGAGLSAFIITMSALVALIAVVVDAVKH